jgi:hypothetical protein
LVPLPADDFAAAGRHLAFGTVRFAGSGESQEKTLSSLRRGFLLEEKLLLREPLGLRDSRAHEW